MVRQTAKRHIPSKQPGAFRAVLDEIRTIAERSAPMRREKGMNTSHGLDIIDHRKVGLGRQPSLTRLGVIVVALGLLQKMERRACELPVVGDGMLPNTSIFGFYSL